MEGMSFGDQPARALKVIPPAALRRSASCSIRSKSSRAVLSRASTY
jgi:hypothetical protein